MPASLVLYQRAASIAPLVESAITAFPGMPFGLPMAVAQQESGFSTTVVNPSTQATGLYQILASSAPKYGIAPGQRTNPRAILPGVLNQFRRAEQAVKSVFPQVAPDDLAGFIYWAHSEGLGDPKRWGKKGLWSALMQLKTRGIAPTVENALLLAKQGAIGRVNKGDGIRNVARNWRMWEQARADLGGNWNGLVAWAQENARGGAVLARGRGRRGMVLASQNASAEGSGGGALLVLGAIGLGLVAFLATRATRKR